MSISIENSWHFNGGLWQDPELLRVKQSLLKYHPKPFQNHELKLDTLWTLRGPRRVGKTVSLKLLISELIEKEVCSPEKIVWTSVEILRSTQQLDQHLREILDKYKPEYLFCDEITSIVGWQTVVKKLRDEGKLSKTCTVLTGSSAFDLKKGSERLAGRKGVHHSTDRVLLPMSYHDFQDQSDKLKIEDYIQSGGFPFRVEECLKSKLENRKFDPLFGTSILEDVFFYEFGRRKLDRNIALEILFRLSQIQPHSISYSGFVKSLNIKNDTAQKYLTVLGDAYLLATIFSFDTGKSRVALKKDRKFAWSDPALAFLANALGQGSLPKEEALVEQLVGVHLLRNFELRLFEGLSAPRNLFTWKSKSGNEIDYLLVNRSQNLTYPVEVKYQNGISPADFQSMEKSFKKGKIVTKSQNMSRELSRGLVLEEFLKMNKEQILSQS